MVVLLGWGVLGMLLLCVVGDLLVGCELVV